MHHSDFRFLGYLFHEGLKVLIAFLYMEGTLLISISPLGGRGEKGHPVKYYAVVEDQSLLLYERCDVTQQQLVNLRRSFMMHSSTTSVSSVSDNSINSWLKHGVRIICNDASIKQMFNTHFHKGVKDSDDDDSNSDDDRNYDNATKLGVSFYCHFTALYFL